MKKKKMILPISLLIGVALLTIIIANIKVKQMGDFTVDDVSRLPEQHACLVLGANPKLANGKTNLYYLYRMQAALQVYAAGKCQKIVVSGDNRHDNYNEPEQMKLSLIALGVPADRIVCDYAGGRTLDSVLRFQSIFGQQQGIVISQKFHNARAIYLARHHHIDLVGYNAEAVVGYNGLRTNAREILSRTRAFLDIHLFHSAARHGGEPIAL